MLLNMFHKCVLITHEVFVGHNTLYLEEEDGLSSEDVRKFKETILGGLLQPRELSNDYL